MRHRPIRLAATLALVVVVVATAVEVPLTAQRAIAASAQGRLEAATRAQGGQAHYPADLDQQRAEDTRDELARLMELYPPALGHVLKLDPTLMTNAAYLAPYPALANFLQRHTEVPRYPTYFLSFVRSPNVFESFEPNDPETRIRVDAMRMWREVMTSLMIFTGFLTVVLTLTWLIRHAVGHRRWLRMTKLQSDVHGRLMERFSNTNELMAYVQSAAGRHFLEGMPVTAEAASAPEPAAPLVRILWSIQAGLVLVCAGMGLLTIKQYMIEEVAQMLLVFGVLGISIGAGFALAAGASYILSARFGLFDAHRNDRAPRA